MTTSRLTTKILATLGPASDSPHRVEALIAAGASAFRLNFSHGEHEEHAKRLETVRAAAKRLGRHVPIVSDLQGPKLRLGKLAGGELKLGYNDTVEAVLGETAPEGTLPIPHKELFAALQPGDSVMIDDGNVRLVVVEGGEERMALKVQVPGLVSNRKGVNIPGRKLDLSALTDKDIRDLNFALDQGTDYVALSFVQTAADVAEAKRMIDGRAKLIAKIEKPGAMEELDAIVREADGVMVARGDLGVELPLEQVPPAQRRIIRTAREQGKIVIVATQMLQSMVDTPTPTRAEASDTATAAYHGADAVMLSAESAVGRHPEAAVAIMARIIRAASEDPGYKDELNASCPNPVLQSVSGATALAAVDAADSVGAKAIVAATHSGFTSLLAAQLRPTQPILALSPDELVSRQISLAWGTTARMVEDTENNFTTLTKLAAQEAKTQFDLADDDLIVILAGIPTGSSGGTNTMKIARIGDEL